MTGNIIKGAIALGGLAVVMGATNPGQATYTEYASEHLLDKAGKVACERVSLCDATKDMPVIAKNMLKNQILKPAIEASTRQQNLGVFSLYTTEVPGVATIKTLGVFGNFFTFSES
ncbi:DUF4359 domain-containing protein [Pannus brasiliensis CCIBt3594]|uniref:DUF4359 domain-containing protein n=1 Tax=Pannus brasiliensis CCIBt3594 TaxID=1427578 RepID=A0AAW9QQZ0_9CHRO